jgi:1,4-alpha-glucan branching enzyme
MLYHFHENFILPLSHDEIVHGKGSLIGKMPGDDWQKFANLRALFAYQWLFPGKQLLFMGGEIGQRAEWNENKELDWSLLDQGPFHRGLQRFLEDLNRIYKSEPALWEADYDYSGFYWIDCGDADNSVLSFVRQNKDCTRQVAVIMNLTPVLRCNYRVGLPKTGFWKEIVNSDAEIYGGSNCGNLGGVTSNQGKWHNQENFAEICLPPMSVVAFASPE